MSHAQIQTKSIIKKWNIRLCHAKKSCTQQQGVNYVLYIEQHQPLCGHYCGPLLAHSAQCNESELICCTSASTRNVQCSISTVITYSVQQLWVRKATQGSPCIVAAH